MARPLTLRRVLLNLEGRAFKPQAVRLRDLETVAVTLDGLEALRLADLEGLYHEVAAERMNVSRATFARILATARRTVADALVHGKALTIEGGVIERTPPGRWPCPVHGRGRRRGRGCRCDAGHTEEMGGSSGRRGAGSA